jgi:CubicO group peptidase (beta-lactamase class C family)/predicted dienelactone hydrolase
MKIIRKGEYLMLYKRVLSLSKGRWFTLLSLFMIAALILSACQPVMPVETAAASAATAPVPHTERFDAPPFGVRGPYAVGVQDFVIEPTAEGERPIPASVWYPALNPDGQAESATYMLDFGNPNFPDFAIGGRALRDAQPDASGGPYPLVVYSHGLTLFRQISSYLAEHLASWGFVVIAGDHEDNWSGLAAGVPHNFVVRPKEITRQIDFAETLGASDGELANLIDMEHVGVTGHSFGAETALLMGGAQLNTNMFLNEWCATSPVDALNDCGAVAALLDQMVETAGLETAPETLWPDWSDPRVDAVVPLALGPQHFGPEGFATVQVPVLLVESELDWYAGAANATYEPYSLLPAGRNAHLVFERADHALFLNSCDAMPALVEQGLGSFCTDSVWEMDRAHDLINHFVTAFLLAELKGDAEAAAALAPENVAFPGIQYESTGYGAAAAPESLLDDATVAKIESTVEEMMAESGTPGYAVGIVKDGEIVYTKGFGVERVGGDEPVTVHSVFGTGSTGKTATAIAVMQLVEAGKIDLDAPVTDYLPYFELADERYKEITVRQLLTHRSGVPAGPTDWFPLPIEYDDGAVERYVRSMGDLELLFAPDAEWSYSNLGMIVLADIVAKVSGQTFEEYLQANVLDPLGMADTMLIIPEGDQAKLTGNHVRSKDGQVVVSDIFPYRRQFTPAEPLYSSITDMARFAAANLNRGEFEGTRILPAETYDAMWEPLSKTNWDFGPILTPTVTDFGMTWMLGELDGHRIVSFGGVDEGYTGELLLAPDDGIAVVANGNYFDFEEFNLASPAAAVEILALLLTEN